MEFILAILIIAVIFLSYFVYEMNKKSEFVPFYFMIEFNIFAILKKAWMSDEDIETIRRDFWVEKSSKYWYSYLVAAIHDKLNKDKVDQSNLRNLNYYLSHKIYFTALRKTEHRTYFLYDNHENNFFINPERKILLHLNLASNSKIAKKINDQPMKYEYLYLREILLESWYMWLEIWLHEWKTDNFSGDLLFENAKCFQVLGILPYSHLDASCSPYGWIDLFLKRQKKYHKDDKILEKYHLTNPDPWYDGPSRESNLANEYMIITYDHVT